MAIVTGAARGLGRAIAARLYERGASVVVNVRDAARANDVARALGDDALAVRGDVTAADFPERVVRDTLDRFGRIDILVNNAGVSHIGTATTTSEADMDRLYAVNVKGVYLCSQAAIPRMVDAGGGVILNLASIASLIGLVDRFAYSMTKGAVLTMTRSIAVDYIKDGIRCNCVCPARVHTPFVDGYLRDAYPGREQEMFRQLSDYQPIGRMAEPEEVAALALYLCSDEASFITGQAYPIDGGVLAF